MSLNDELKAAKKRMLAQQEAEAKKKSKPRRAGGGKSTTEWSKEDEIIAYYLYKSNSSKLLKENYSKKRKVSLRAMTMKMTMFQELEKGRETKSMTIHSKKVLEECSAMTMEVLQKTVITILRGEYQAKLAAVSAQSQPTTVLKR